jgi:hypothetical protein
MHTMYAITYRKTSSDRDAYPLNQGNASKFPFPYLWVLWSNRWMYDSGQIAFHAGYLCNLMSQAIIDPTSNYRPEHAIQSVEHFVASFGRIRDVELRVFFEAQCHPNWLTPIVDDPARVLFLAVLTLKLCQQSNVSMLRIFSLLIGTEYGGDPDQVRLLFTLPLLRSLLLKTALPGDNNNTVRTPETDLTSELSPELDAFISVCCDRLEYLGDSPQDEEANCIIVSVLSLLPALSQSHLVANQIIRRSPGYTDLWHSAFKYCDEHGEPANACPLMIFTSEPVVNCPTRQKLAQMIPQLCKQLNELDSTFKLPEESYTFEYELRARDIMEAAYVEYISSSATPESDRPQAITPSNNITLPCVTNSAAQEQADLRGTGGGLGPGDVVIDITLPVDTDKANRGDVDSAAVIGKGQIG